MHDCLEKLFAFVDSCRQQIVTIVEDDGLGVHFDKKIEVHPKEGGNKEQEYTVFFTKQDFYWFC